MILGVRIINFDVFEDDMIGLMIEDSAQYAGKDPSDRGIRLRNLNALIGRNNTGKSAFIRALSFVKRAILTDVGKASTSDNRPGFMNLLIDKSKPASFLIFFKIQDPQTGKSDFLQYELTIGASEQGSPVIVNEQVLSSVKNEDGTIAINEVFTNSVDARVVSDERITALSILGRLNGSDEPIKLLFNEIDRWFFCAFSAEESTDYFSVGNAPGGHKHLNSEGSNMGNVLDYIKSLNDGVYDRLMDEINSKIPSMHKKKKNLPQNLQGSPEKLFKYLLLLRDPDPKTTIFIETPDRDLYHDMVDVLADDMREFTFRHPYSQIIFSTHNPYIVETMSPKEIWVFSRDYNEETDEEDNVKVRCAGSDPVVMALTEQGVGMGAIWYGGHLDQGSSEYDDEGMNNAY
ncbi:MAG: ATP-binding protein [Clostridiales bacterium]|nr:ATP-binding protein [Clostridiales bacterium]